jgi:hypothetical protein
MIIPARETEEARNMERITFTKAEGNQDSQRHQTTPEEEKLKQAHHETLNQEHDDNNEKFSPGEADNYDAEDFNTD